MSQSVGQSINPDSSRLSVCHWSVNSQKVRQPDSQAVRQSQSAAGLISRSVSQSSVRQSLTQSVSQSIRRGKVNIYSAIIRLLTLTKHYFTLTLTKVTHFHAVASFFKTESFLWNKDLLTITFNPNFVTLYASVARDSLSILWAFLTNSVSCPSTRFHLPKAWSTLAAFFTFDIWS